MKNIMQKIAGIFFIIASFVMIRLENDATCAVIFVPLGLWLIFTRENMMN